MTKTQQVELLFNDSNKLTARQVNILKSTKRNGTASFDSKIYLEELDVEIIDNIQPIQFLRNSKELVHRWAPYVQGFSAQFVQKIIDKYRSEYHFPVVFDPFAGSGTVLVQSKFNNFEVYGVELNPLLHFIAKTKLNTWKTNPEKLTNISEYLLKKHVFKAPEFLKSQKHFKPKVLRNLEILKSGIDNFRYYTVEDKNIKNLMLVAFSAILIECSNLKRTPCLGYVKNKEISEDEPMKLFRKRIGEIAYDLNILKSDYKEYDKKSEVYLENSKDFKNNTLYDLVITSPPYMNGMDYVINYKIEMGWLGFADNHRELKQIKDEMVVCDNVSKGLIKDFTFDNKRYANEWLKNIKYNIIENIKKRGSYRRPDMPEIVHKYFNDMHKIMKNIIPAIKSGGRFILVVGDSLIADVYIPTDLIIAKIGKELGLKIEKIEKARNRRSGQIRSYKLRESIITLKKE